MMQEFGLSMLWYWLAYVVVTFIFGVGHTVFNIVVLKMSSMADGPGMGEGYEATKPWHPLYNILIFPIAAYMYLSTLPIVTLHEVIVTSTVWGTLTIIVDVVGWVIIKHPWSLTFKEFYIDYQPWITLIYLAIYISPFLAYMAL
ncbi:hypothetical protein B279_01165 [Streptococcus equinus ATCC 33317]|uniref:hypothetical protein n=1 Tax=Streptococcus equinus TaxID=1335 RepID=UPI0005018F3E|nr:hypothetical protein [Streptococcus equinus]KFN87240.1 hypothetical protein B279_01165 [Streptococcus equinus ATCC 33317]VED90454.1 Uncharacterised protein [Streptococcus equinus]VTS80495.1 Uncharacterised protein [Streptococcus equinus]